MVTNTHISNSKETITVTKAQLYKLFAAWEDERRCGRLETVQEIENQTVEEVAEATTIDFCDRLSVLKDKEEDEVGEDTPFVNLQNLTPTK